MSHVLEGLKFGPENIRLEKSINAVAEANVFLRSEGIPFREAYRGVAERYNK